MTAMAMDPYSSIVEVRIWLTFRSVSVSFGSMTDGGGIVLELFAIDDVDPLYPCAIVLLVLFEFMIHQHGLFFIFEMEVKRCTADDPSIVFCILSMIEP